jgi:hypothetical protein
MPLDEQASLEVGEESTFVDPKQLVLERDADTSAPEAAPKTPRKKPTASRKIAKLNVQSSAAQAREDEGIPGPVESGAEEKDVTLPKGKRKHAETSDELADQEPPAKKIRRSIKNSSTVRTEATTIQHSSVIISSDRGPSPIYGGSNESGKPASNDSQTAAEANSTPESVLVNPTVSELRGQGGGQQTASPTKPKGTYSLDTFAQNSTSHDL